MTRRGDFFEEDESVDKLAAIFDRGPTVVSDDAPALGWNDTLQVPDSVERQTAPAVLAGSTFTQ